MRERPALILVALAGLAIIVGSLLEWEVDECYVLRAYGASSYSGRETCTSRIWEYRALGDIALVVEASLVVVLALAGLLGRGGRVALLALIAALLAWLLTSPLELLLPDGDGPAIGAWLALGGGVALVVGTVGLRPRRAGHWSVAGRIVLGLVAVAAPLVNLFHFTPGTSVWQASRLADVVILAAAVAAFGLAVRGRGAWLAMMLAAFIAGAALAAGPEVLAIEAFGGRIHVDGIATGTWLGTCLVIPLAITATVLAARDVNPVTRGGGSRNA